MLAITSSVAGENRRPADTRRIDNPSAAFLAGSDREDVVDAQGQSTRLARFALAFLSERHVVFGPDVSVSDGWDIILVLYLAEADGRRLTVRDAIERAGATIESGRRRIAHYSATGLIIGDGGGDLDDMVTLAPATVTKVEDLIERARAALDRV
ncbi:MAG: hypothetical protein ACRYHC_05935 [Janthinobacterium lividum]